MYNQSQLQICQNSSTSCTVQIKKINKNLELHEMASLIQYKTQYIQRVNFKKISHSVCILIAESLV